MAIKAGKYEIYITRKKINREGYTSGKFGQYYGYTGQDVYSYETWPFEYSLAGEIRADSMKDAKDRILGMAKFKNEIKAAEDPNYFKSNPSSLKVNIIHGNKLTKAQLNKVLDTYGPTNRGAVVDTEWASKRAFPFSPDGKRLLRGTIYMLPKSNPSSLKVKAGEWIPCHAVRVRAGKLEIMKDALANKGKARISNPQQINLFHAKEIFRQMGAKPGTDYFELSSSQLAELRDLPEYKKYKTSGAKAKSRAFIDKLNRIIDKG